jgi:cell filamentation protein
VADPYLLPGTDVLRNRVGIVDGGMLARFEVSASLARVAELAVRPVEGSFDLDHLRAVHRHVFQDVYDWAGELRTVDLAKGMPFCRCDAIASEAVRVFGAIAKAGYLVGLDREHFLAALAEHWGEVNALHPFREGNTRTQRVFFDQLATVAGRRMDWALLDYPAFVRARFDNLRTGRTDQLAAVLGQAITH